MAAIMFDLNCTPPLLDLNCTPPVSCTPPTGGYAPDQDAGRTHWLSLPLFFNFCPKHQKSLSKITVTVVWLHTKAFIVRLVVV
jgi:hypothetical protein